MPDAVAHVDAVDELGQFRQRVHDRRAAAHDDERSVVRFQSLADDGFEADITYELQEALCGPDVSRWWNCTAAIQSETQ
jgi:hypothetical protein